MFEPDPNLPQPAGDAAYVDAGEGPCELVLVKHDQRYVFRCAPGEEASLLERLGELVQDPGNDLDWFDAAVLSHQVGRQLGRRLGQPGV